MNERGRELVRVGESNRRLSFFGLSFLLRLFLAVVVRHGNNGKNEIDQIEGSEEDDDDEEEHVIRSIGTDYLQVNRSQQSKDFKACYAFAGVVIFKLEQA